MSKIREKLNRTQGASLLGALLFFLVCLTVGSMILTAATAGAERTRDRYEQQQSYFAIASAARLLKAELSTYTYTEGETWQTWQVGTDTDGNPVMDSGWRKIDPFLSKKDGSVATGSGDLLTDAYALLDHTGGEGGLPEVTKSFAIDNVTGTDQIPPVQTKLQMKEGGHAQLVLTCGEYAMTVRFTARTAYNTDDVTYRYWITSWNEGTVAKAKGAE